MMIEDALTQVEQEDEFGVLPELTETEKTVWDVVRGRIENREMTMSFSKIKQFSETPFHFVRYMVKSEMIKLGLIKDKVTDAMMLGRLVDCLSLTPDLTATEFAVEPVGAAMNSLKGCNALLMFYGDMLQGELDYLAPVENKPLTKSEAERLDELSEMIDAISKALFAGVKMDDKKQTIRAAREICKQSIVSAAMMEQATTIRNRAYSNEASRRILYQFTSTQVESEFDAFGWKWKGKFDGEGERLIADMKMMVSAKPDKAMRTIRDMHYDWQGALYTLPRRAGKKFYNICLDRQMGVSVIHLDNRVLTGAWHAVEEMIQHFERCIFEGMDDPQVWYSSYDFFAPRNGIYEYGR